MGDLNNPCSRTHSTTNFAADVQVWWEGAKGQMRFVKLRSPRSIRSGEMGAGLGRNVVRAQTPDLSHQTDAVHRTSLVAVGAPISRHHHHRRNRKDGRKNQPHARSSKRGPCDIPIAES